MSRKLGYYAEKIICHYLHGKEYSVLAINFTTRTGEIDIIARRNDVVFFIEVKSRTMHDAYGAELGWCYTKQKRFISAVKVYVSKYKVYTYQIDLLCVYIKQRKIIHYENVDIHPLLFRWLP